MLKKIQSREFIFAATSLILAILLGLIFFQTINFLLEEIQIALNGDASKNPQTVQFNLSGAKDIEIRGENAPVQPQTQPTSTQPQTQNTPPL
ncbi:MAG: hypothetical protein NTW60_01015 [Candidatus Wolfebacteria bacterium]|nr:hypothetical protein [Candidatus Wolfebacteria bacterium]